MKIGLYGGIANNMYVFAKSPANQGVETCFIRDRGDRYPFSQPVWEDIRATLDYDDMAKAANWTWQEWTNWETHLGWKAPVWLVDPLETPCSKVAQKDTKGLVDKVKASYLVRKRDYRRAVLKLMT